MTELLAQETGRGTTVLPEGWAHASFGDLADYLNGRAFKKTDWADVGRPIIRIQNLTNNSETINRFPEPVEERYVVRDGDLLISWSATLGAYIYRGEEAVLNQHIFKVRPYVDKTFLYYLTVAYIEELRRQAHGSGMQHITKGKFEATSISLPPLNEQCRIVEKIEELFTRLDAGVEALKHAKAQLKKYRQSALNAAVTGELSREWREAHADEMEPASELLERILEERREKWTGKKYKEPAAPELEAMPVIPASWVWTTTGALCDCIVPNRDKPKSFSGETPWITLPSFSDGFINRLNASDANQGLADEEIEQYKAKVIPEGSVIMSCIGQFGLSAVLMQDSVINQQLHGFLIPEALRAEYLAYAIKTQARTMEKMSTATTISYLNKTRCNSVPVALPPYEEQQIITEEVERRFSVIDRLEATIEESLKRSESLRQSILKRAFSGKLVEQDPEDEPASALLERIWEERQASEKKVKKGRSKKATAEEPSLFSGSEG